MRLHSADRRRVLWWAILLAIAGGLFLGWWAGIFASSRTPETRAREATEALREKVREMTH